MPDVDVALSPLCAPRATRSGAGAREGLAVVAVGGAPAGGGGALRDLVRGIAPAALDPCAGTDGSMLGVSGIVPDGVEAVFVTSPDGSATRADVHDNGYAFVLARPRRPEPRHLVWTGRDGTPHVQPLAFFAAIPGRSTCRSVKRPPRVTPDPYAAGCSALAPGLIGPARPALPPPARIAPRPLALLAGPCDVAPRPVGVVPGPPARIAPAPPRAALVPAPRRARPAPVPRRMPPGRVTPGVPRAKPAPAGPGRTSTLPRPAAPQAAPPARPPQGP